MISNILLLSSLLISLNLKTSISVTIIEAKGKEINTVTFHQLDGHSLTGRPAYISEDKNMYLYHIVMDPIADGIGRWVISDELWATDSALQFIDSWAVSPCAITELHDNPERGWLVYDAPSESWGLDVNFELNCVSDNNDDLIYLDVPSDIWTTGFFIKMAKEEEDNPNVYMQIKRFESINNLFLYKYENRWLLGDNPEVDNAIAFLENNEDEIITEAKDIKPSEWLFHTPDVDPEFPWTKEWVTVMSKTNEDNSLIEYIRKYRSIRDFPSIQGEHNGLYTLRNGLALPAVGLGTGGIPEDKMYDTTLTALRMGYRLLDLAREYNNEQVIHKIFTDTINDDTTPKPHEVFLLSKVWPTELGFEMTSRAIHSSRSELGLTYIDNYMLHWPACYSDISWMHCDTVADPNGTWQQSYKALEKAYAEGDIMSIGISNFDVELLDQIHTVANTLPHILQNYASIGDDDIAVRKWCKATGVIFQPYASARNEKDMKNILPNAATAINQISNLSSKSHHSVIYRYFLDHGDSIIPRSTDTIHLMENLANLNWHLTSEQLKQLTELTMTADERQ